MKPKCCTVCGDSPTTSRGLCNKHYHRWKQAQKPTRPCGCGCGEQTRYGFVWGHHTRLFTSEEQSRRGRMNNGDSQRDRGEGRTYRKMHGRHEHRRVMEAIIGRPLRSDEVVHHKNENKRDNRPENLELMTQAEHTRHHFTEYWKRKRNGGA